MTTVVKVARAVAQQLEGVGRIQNLKTSGMVLMFPSTWGQQEVYMPNGRFGHHPLMAVPMCCTCRVSRNLGILPCRDGRT